MSGVRRSEATTVIPYF